jgi:beta-N-acetylhexosaminidase
MPDRYEELRKQVGQLLIMGFEGTEPSTRLRSTVATLQPAGIILFARNVSDPQQTWRLVRECERCVQTPMFTCIDLEGGTVDRLRDAIAPAPAAADVFQTGNRKLFRKHGRVIGDEVRALGLNTDFAPVFDLALPPSRKVLTTRTVSADPKETVRYAREFLRGLKDVRVLGCGKHFPGLGEAKLDTHKELPSIRKPWKQMWEEDLYPYRELRRDIPFVMVAHASYPDAVKEKVPASLSQRWMGDVLRKKIGYKGLVISDDLEMGGVLATASIEDAAIETISAGADIFLVCNNEANVWRTYHAVLREAERDRRFARRVAESARRVMAFKKKSRELKQRMPAPTQKCVDRLRRAVWELSEEARLEQVVTEEHV